MEFIDTHCHIHSDDYNLSVARVLANAESVGVTRLLCVGTDKNDSQLAIEFAQKHKTCFASIGIHPHDSKNYMTNGRIDSVLRDDFHKLAISKKVVAVGECGLDYYYQHSPKEDQEVMLRFQIELALTNKLPLIFHVRQAFNDFWKIVDDYAGLKGVVHSFSDTPDRLEQILKRGFYVGLNGIMTFSKDEDQLTAAKMVPLERMVLETDAPFLTPVPYRGKICEPKHVVETAEFLGRLRNEPLERIAEASTANAKQLFNI